jgi:hypothetical protein
MLLLKGNVVRFRLSPEGEKALEGLVEKSLQAFVEEVDELGAWILIDRDDEDNGARTTMLLKWDYFSTAVLEVQPEVPAREKPVIGFKSKDS